MIGPSERQIVSSFNLKSYTGIICVYCGYPTMFSQECQLAILYFHKTLFGPSICPQQCI